MIVYRQLSHHRIPSLPLLTIFSDELVILVISFLSETDAARCRRVSRSWHLAIRHHHALWSSRLRAEFHVSVADSHCDTPYQFYARLKRLRSGLQCATLHATSRVPIPFDSSAARGDRRPESERHTDTDTVTDSDSGESEQLQLYSRTQLLSAHVISARFTPVAPGSTYAVVRVTCFSLVCCSTFRFRTGSLAWLIFALLLLCSFCVAGCAARSCRQPTAALC